MPSREKTDSASLTSDHETAATAFVDRARTRFDTEIAELYVFGSTARGEASGLASDIDVLVVLDDDADRKTTADALRDLAYDVMLECGPVVELHILSETEFERDHDSGNPFIRNVVDEGRSYA